MPVIPALCLCLVLATHSALPAMQPLRKIPKALVIAGATNIHDIRYLPEWRYTDTPGPFGDYEMLLNLYLPKHHQRQRLPLAMYVHGGAYAAGHKDDHYPKALFSSLIAKGFAVASMNYILNHRAIRPQVYWDFEEAARFLRSNADTYGLDPNAFAAIGISAGGWLITTNGHADGSVYAREGEFTGEEDLRDGAYTHRFLESGMRTFLCPIRACETGYPGVSGTWQLLVYDFSKLYDRPSPFTPPLIGMVGKNRTEIPQAYAKAGIDWTPLVLDFPPSPKRYLRGVHAPNMEASTARKPDGSFGPISEVLAELMHDKLYGSQAQTPAPDIWPATRRINKAITMSLIATDPTITIHYTLDGSKPSKASPIYKQPVSIQPDTTVKAMATMPGKRPSRIIAAQFIKAPPLPKVSAPTARALPPAVTGQPYTCTFKADVPKARFFLAGDLGNKNRNNMLLAADGRFHGTPLRPGRYWLQVWVNDGRGRVATHRNYTWTVTGKDLAPAGQKAALTADQNTHVATLEQWSERNVGYLRGEMQLAGIQVVLQPIDGKRAWNSTTMILVPTSDQHKAKAALTAIAATTGQTLSFAK